MANGTKWALGHCPLYCLSASLNSSRFIQCFCNKESLSQLKEPKRLTRKFTWKIIDDFESPDCQWFIWWYVVPSDVRMTPTGCAVLATFVVFIWLDCSVRHIGICLMLNPSVLCQWLITLKLHQTELVLNVNYCIIVFWSSDVSTRWFGLYWCQSLKGARGQKFVMMPDNGRGFKSFGMNIVIE